MDEANELADSIIKNSQSAIALVKTAIHRGIETDMETAIEIETGLALAAFKEKR
jgi:enoyl-CoA hydratase/carnithine racemase